MRPLCVLPRVLRTAVLVATAALTLPFTLTATPTLPFTLTPATLTPTTTTRHYLSGTGSHDAVLWEFYCTAGRNSGVWTTIAVPSCWETQGFGTYDYGVEFRPSTNRPVMPKAPDEQGHYRRTFEAPKEWQGQRVRVVFEGVLTDAEVRINGQLAGPVHQGGFYRFAHDITDKLHFGASNTLEVKVSKRSANDSVNRAERQADYWNFGGIFRPVWLEVAPPVAIERVAIDAKHDGKFSAHVFLAGAAPADAEVSVRFSGPDGTPDATVGRAPLAAGSGATDLTGAAAVVTTQLAAVKPWSAETPALYTAHFTLRAGDRVLHTFTQRFGFRTFELRPGDGLYVNGAKITLKGINRHSFWPETGRTLSPQLNHADAALIKEANMNAVRMSHYPPDPEFLAACDELGLYVMNELGGWQQSYDTPTGRRLIGQMIARDVNHPSILFWDNGNEGGENLENDDEFAKHDPQRRPVVHPWAVSFRGLNTKHYRPYAETAQFAEGPDIFLPTEFLHGLFDGGHGAGLDDFWKILGEKPRAAGGFLWVWADEAVARADQGGRLDANRDLAPDGLVGPRREKSGSYETLREIWSPVQIPLPELPADFAGVLPVRNRFDHLDLSHVTFEWRLLRFSAPGALMFHRSLAAHGRVAGPALAPRTDGTLTLPLPADWRGSDVLQLTAFDGRERALWTWTWRWKTGAAAVGHAFNQIHAPKLLETERTHTLVSGRNRAVIDRTTGLLVRLERDGRPLSLGQGPRLVAYKRDARLLAPVAEATSPLVSLTPTTGPAGASLTAEFSGALRAIRWTMQPDGDLRLDYTIKGPGTVDLLGLDFDYPEERMRAKEWLGGGPHRVWQNRLKGAQLARWVVPFNDPVPGVSWTHEPEFKGWFGRWDWIMFTTTEGRFALLNDGGQPFVGTYAPRDGLNNPVLVLPRLGLGVYQVIPAIGTKQSAPSDLGPQGQPQTITGEIKGSLLIRLLDQP